MIFPGIICTQPPMSLTSLCIWRLSKMSPILFHNTVKIWFFFPLPVIKISIFIHQTLLPFCHCLPLAPWLQFFQVCLFCLPSGSDQFPLILLLESIFHVVSFVSSFDVIARCWTVLRCAASAWNKCKFYIHLSFHRCGCNIDKFVYKIVVPRFSNIIWNWNIPACRDLASACTWEIRPCEEYQGLQL